MTRSSLVRLRTAALAASLTLWFAPSAHAASTAVTYTVGVDFATPPGHNFAAVDYFPRGDAGYPLTVHTGDVLDFRWNQGSPDQLHTVTFTKIGESPATLYADHPIAGPDGDDSPAGAVFNFPTPTFPPPGSGAPGACGDAAAPCTFDGSAELSSGAAPTAPGHDFYVRISAAPGTYTYFCLIHPGMSGSVTVSTGAATSPTVAASEADAQTAADLAEARAAESSIGAPATVTNADGSRTYTAFAGLGTAHTEVLEMLPARLDIRPGDHVVWKTTTVKDIHTVTFPYGNGSDRLDPFPPPVCERSGPTDTPAAGPPPSFGCGSPTSAEFPLVAGPAGPTSIGPHGYRLAGADGGVFTHGDATYLGSEGATRLAAPVVAAATTADGQGYWSAAADGGVFTHGDAPFLGSLGSTRLARPIVALVPTPDGKGYLEVAADGGVFTFGDAPFLGSLGGTKLTAPIVAADVAHGFGPGPGYWLASADGHVFNFGPGAGAFGSLAGTRLAAPIVGMAATPDGLGYWLVGADGGVFTFGDAPFLGSQGATKLAAPIVGMAPTPSGLGYWLVAADGGVFSFGDAHFYGSEGGAKLAATVVAMSAMPATAATSGVIATPPAPFPSSTPTYTFTGAGAYTYQCRIHDHMRGVVIAS